ncbi:MAG: AmmeMemoRadiSam system radical SAM enzyme [Actinomycetota bacterium]
MEAGQKMPKEAILYEKLDGKRARCHVCPWLCNIAPGRRGYCCVRENRDGKIYALSYAKVSSMAADPIEKKPLFHFYPGSLVFSLGSLGCNLRCLHCQNWEIAHSRMVGEEPGVVDLQPEEAVGATKRHGCQGLAWTYNEPTIWVEYTLDSAKLCKKENLYTVYVTNGYTTPEALDAMGPHLDAYRVDLKGFTEGFYRKLTKALHLKPVLDAAIRAKTKWNMHVEIVTNVIPTMNDDEGQLRGIAGWIRDNLGDKTPWHVTRFIPYLELSHLYPTPVRTLERAREIGLEEGLKFVYIGNVPGHPGENTYCPKCKELVVERNGYTITRYEVESGKCKHCGEDLNIRG